jgi:hypothetical protein
VSRQGFPRKTILPTRLVPGFAQTAEPGKLRAVEQNRKAMGEAENPDGKKRALLAGSGLSSLSVLPQVPATESDVLAIAERWLSQGRRVAVATVVQTSGSAPRQGGSHIAVRDDGAFAGSVSAGCVENAVIELALAAIEDGQNRTAHFGVDDGVFAPGLLCGGEIEILVEPVI